MEKVVSPKLGIYYWVLGLGLIIAIPLGVAMILSPSSNLIARWLAGPVLVLSPLVALVFGPSNINYRITQKGFTFGRPKMSAQTDFDWTSVSKVVDTGSGVLVKFFKPINGRKTVVVLTDYVANTQELKRAIFEASFLANPTVEIQSPLISKWGLPPYGIFKNHQ